MFKFTESIELTNKQAKKETFQKRLKRYNSGEFQDLKRKNNCIKERFKNQKLSTTEIRKFNYIKSETAIVQCTQTYVKLLQHFCCITTSQKYLNVVILL